MLPHRLECLRRWLSRLTGLCLALFGAACLLLTSGCASSLPAGATSMTPAGLQVSRHHPWSVLIHVEGGRETDPTLPPEISSDAFRDALTQAVHESQLFKPALAGASADYRLEVGIVKHKLTAARFTFFKVDLATRWKLVRADGGLVVFNEFIESTGIARKSVGTTRLRLALENSAAENIKLGLTKLAELDL
jgi:hypothetical protein